MAFLHLNELGIRVFAYGLLVPTSGVKSAARWGVNRRWHGSLENDPCFGGSSPGDRDSGQ